MVKLTSEELGHLERLSAGNWGTVYRDGDKVYKIYNEKVENSMKEMVDNPLLIIPALTKWKLGRMIKRNQEIEHSDLAEDIVYLDGHFAGMQMPYYDGVKFIDLKHLPLEERIRLSRELSRNTKELTDHYIYPLDIKNPNIFLVNGEVKMFDLDDFYTRITSFKNPHYLRKSIIILDHTIKLFLEEFYRSTSRPNVIRATTRKYYKINKTYEGIDEYLDYKSVPHSYLFVDENFNLSGDRLISGRRVVIVYDKLTENDLLVLLNALRQRGIEVYDVIDRSQIEFYMNNNICNECLHAHEGSILTLK